MDPKLGMGKDRRSRKKGKVSESGDYSENDSEPEGNHTVTRTKIISKTDSATAAKPVFLEAKAVGEVVSPPSAGFSTTQTSAPTFADKQTAFQAPISSLSIFGLKDSTLGSKTSLFQPSAFGSFRNSPKGWQPACNINSVAKETCQLTDEQVLSKFGRPGDFSGPTSFINGLRTGMFCPLRNIFRNNASPSFGQPSLFANRPPSSLFSSLSSGLNAPTSLFSFGKDTRTSIFSSPPVPPALKFTPTLPMVHLD